MSANTTSASPGGSTADFPRAILYAWPASVWSTVPQLCLIEKGYSEEEYIVKMVDITKGENFSPSYLKINMHGTIPTLVVPMMETTGDGVDTRYRSLRDTSTICDFLDQARSAGSSNTVSDRPAPALAAATIEGKATTDQVIAMVHHPAVDPNFLNMAARDAQELQAKNARKPGQMLTDRKQALQRYMSEVKDMSASQTATSFEKNMMVLLEAKAEANEALWQVYNGQGGEDKQQAFYAASKRIWTDEIPNAFDELAKIIKGPFVLGDQISLGDLHLISWLTRLVTVAGGHPESNGIEALQAELGERKIPAALRTFWNTWVDRESFNKVLVPASRAFIEAAGH